MRYHIPMLVRAVLLALWTLLFTWFSANGHKFVNGEILLYLVGIGLIWTWLWKLPLDAVCKVLEIIVGLIERRIAADEQDTAPTDVVYVDEPYLNTDNELEHLR